MANYSHGSFIFLGTKEQLEAVKKDIFTLENFGATANNLPNKSKTKVLNYNKFEHMFLPYSSENYMVDIGKIDTYFDFKNPDRAWKYLEAHLKETGKDYFLDHFSVVVHEEFKVKDILFKNQLGLLIQNKYRSLFPIAFFYEMAQLHKTNYIAVDRYEGNKAILYTKFGEKEEDFIHEVKSYYKAPERIAIAKHFHLLDNKDLVLGAVALKNFIWLEQLLKNVDLKNKDKFIHQLAIHEKKAKDELFNGEVYPRTVFKTIIDKLNGNLTAQVNSFLENKFLNQLSSQTRSKTIKL